MAGARGSARRELVRRLVGPRNRRRGPRPGRSALRGLRRVLVPGLVVLLGVAAWPAIGRAVRTHPYFAVREVIVRDARRLTPDRIRTAAGIVPGMSIWDVDAAAAAERLRAEPWVRAAAVRRDLPHRVVIQVREHRPVAIVALREPKPALYYVAAHGRVFAPVASEDPHDFPYITGLGAADLAQGAFGPRALRRALALVRVAGRAGVFSAISEIHVDASRGLTLLPVRPAVPVEMGSGRFADKLARLEPVLRLWAGRETEMAAVSLLFDDQVIVRTRTTKRASPARRTGKA